MQQNAKLLAKKINKSLDDLGVTPNIRDRAVILGKMVHIPKPLIRAILEGQTFPPRDVLEKIATELEIDVSQLLKSDA